MKDNEITLLKNNQNRNWDDTQWVDEFYRFLQGQIPEGMKLARGHAPKMSDKKAFAIIWYLQEHFPVLPDTIERCDYCGELYDSNSEGGCWETKGKHFCDSCRYENVPENYDRGKRQQSKFNTMQYNELELKTLVIEEAQKLLVHATAEERGKLDFKTLSNQKIHRCIYGQMTNCCFGNRATELLKLCAVPYSAYLFEGHKDHPKHELDTEFRLGWTRGVGAKSAFSPIEFYISTPNTKNATLIAFLRGERETLTVDDL